MVIDSNVYWMDESVFEQKNDSAFLKELNACKDTVGYFEEKNGIGQIVVEKPAGCQNLNYVQGEYKLDSILKDMDDFGVDQAVLKMPGCSEWMSLETCKSFNDGMHDFQKQSGNRLVAMGVVPPAGSPEVLAEIDRCRKDLGIKTFQLASHYGDAYLDDPQFAPFFEKLNEEPTVVYIHHSPLPTAYAPLLDYNNLRRSYGRCEDQTTAVMREVFSGFFRKYPNLTFVHSMLGGGCFALANMFFPENTNKDTTSRFVSDNSAKDDFKNHIYFEMSHSQPWGKDALECAVKVLGADHIIYGSSYPVRKVWMEKGADFVRNLEIPEEEKEMMLWKNARDLYQIPDVEGGKE